MYIPITCMSSTWKMNVDRDFIFKAVQIINNDNIGKTRALRAHTPRTLYICIIVQLRHTVQIASNLIFTRVCSQNPRECASSTCERAYTARERKYYTRSYELWVAHSCEHCERKYYTRTYSTAHVKGKRYTRVSRGRPAGIPYATRVWVTAYTRVLCGLHARAIARGWSARACSSINIWAWSKFLNVRLSRQS